MEANVADLKRVVIEEGADLGLAFDGDGDRLGVVDERGVHQEADRVLMLLARDFLTRHPGERVMMDVKCSETLLEDIRRHGGVPFMWKTGHSLAKRKMREEGILLAGEVSGHMFFGEGYYGFDDAVLAAIRLLLVVAKENKPLSAHWADVPHSYATPELKAPTPDDEKFAVVEEVARYFRERYPTLDIDGVRVKFPQGWALVRASNTNPYLTLRFEASSPQALEEMRKIIYDKLSEYPAVTLPK
jgi:phosphomannomutase/phosphoglucomutase